MEIFWSEKLGLAKRTKDAFQTFVTGMSKRIAQGHARYGHPDKGKKYLTRLVTEVKEYQKTGNVEHLYNTSVYCILEMLEPENKKFHYDPSVDSVTRGRGWE